VSGVHPEVDRARSIGSDTGATDRRGVWAAPTDDGQLCVASEGGWEAGVLRISCAAATVAAKHGLFATGQPSPAVVREMALDPGSVDVRGLVPDGISSVEFTLANGDRSTRRVVRNGVAATFSSRPTDAVFVTESGARQAISFGVGEKR
jgi:hypothetical protein